jgi:hypothetical protein
MIKIQKNLLKTKESNGKVKIEHFDSFIFK